MQEDKDLSFNSADEADKSAQTQSNSSEVKVTVIKCISIVLCVALVAVTLSQCITKYSDSNLSIAEVISSSIASGSGNQAAPDQYGSSDADSVDTTTPDSNAVPGDDASQSAQQTTQQDGGAAKPDTSAPVADKAPSTKQEIVDYFNKAVNKVKPGAKSITQTTERNYQAASIDLGPLGGLKGIVNKLIEANMGENKEKCGLTAQTAAEKNKIFPVENETWASKLTANDVKSATLTEKNGVYTVTIKVLDDALSETTKHGESHHGRAFSIVQTSSIYDNAGPVKSLLKGLEIGYSNGTIIASIDSKTGQVTHISYDFVWTLHVSIAEAPFGIHQEFDIKW